MPPHLPVHSSFICRPNSPCRLSPITKLTPFIYHFSSFLLLFNFSLGFVFIFPNSSVSFAFFLFFFFAVFNFLSIFVILHFLAFNCLLFILFNFAFQFLSYNCFLLVCFFLPFPFFSCKQKLSLSFLPVAYSCYASIISFSLSYHVKATSLPPVTLLIKPTFFFFCRQIPESSLRLLLFAD
ncbi:unnamed protein product [Acanthosepion pharaonis]|uniref:Uncharacterized protein n=1 Tax=Acanthosepion pharaonis TaxID=158019 RepID=A0A812BRK3_ACAPH|nr:unnamed protein product [Sepia pharaonis]